MARSILDYNVVQPGYETAGAEPTLRMLIHAYYDKHFEPSKALALAEEYIAQLRTVYPSAQ